MVRRLLITVGDDFDSLYGVRFAGSFFRHREDMELTLLHVAPRFESMDPKEHLRLHEMDVILSDIYAKKGQLALEIGERFLLHQDFSRQQVTCKLIKKRHGMVQDILEEARHGGHQAVVLGRRGYSVFEKIVHPRISEEVLELKIDLPLWVCRHPGRNMMNVLLCVDGSESSLKAVDHAGFMVGREEQHRITLLHVRDESGEKVEEILATAGEKLVSHGISRERIGSLVVEEPDVAGVIRREARGGSYAVVALGHHGVKSERASEDRFMGSKSLELIEVLERSALWISR